MVNFISQKYKRLMVVGGSPDSVNTNTIIRQLVTEGFAETLGDEYVMNCSLEFSHLKAKTFAPDIIVVFGSCLPNESNYIALHQFAKTNNIPLVFWLHDDPYEFDAHIKIVNLADFIFSNDRFASLHYDTGKASHLPLAASKKLHYRPIKSETEMDYDFFFCGAAFENRIQVIKDLDPFLRNQKTLIIGPGWASAKLPYCHEGRLSNKEFADIANSSKFVINIGRHLNLANDYYNLPASTPGPRTFETAMAGGLQVFFAEGLEILDYFNPKTEIILFNTKAECEEIVNTIPPSQRHEMRKNSQARAMTDHTYATRGVSLLNKVDSITTQGRGQ